MKNNTKIEKKLVITRNLSEKSKFKKSLKCLRYQQSAAERIYGMGEF